MPNSAAVCLARLDHEDRLERRAQQLLAWSQRVGISRLEGPGSQAPGRFAPTLGPLAASRLLCASEFEALSAVSRNACKELGEPELLAPVLRTILAGFAETRGLAWAAVERLSKTEAAVDSARRRVKALTRAEMLSLKQELQAAAPHHQFKPAQCFAALQGVSILIQPDEKMQDEFAVAKLFASGQLIDRTVNFAPEQMTLVHRQKLSTFMKRHRDALERNRVRNDAASAFVQWLDAISFVIEELPKVIGLYRAKEAVQSHIVPLAQWALRPQLNISLGRAGQPPLMDPDMVGRLRGLADLPRASVSCSPAKSTYTAGWRAGQKPILGQPVASEVPAFAPAPPAFAAPPSAKRPQPRPSQVPAASKPSPEASAPAPGSGQFVQQWVQRNGLPATTSGPTESAKPMSRRPSTCSTASTEREIHGGGRRPSTCSTASTEREVHGEENLASAGPWTTEELFAHQREKDEIPIDFCLSSDEEDEPLEAEDEWMEAQKAQKQGVRNTDNDDEWLQPRMAMAG